MVDLHALIEELSRSIDKHLSNSKRTANKDFGRSAGTWQMLLDVLLGNKTDAALPAGRRVVQNVVHLEAVGKHGNKIVELNSEQYVVLVDVGVYKIELGWVTGVEKGVASDLEHGSDTSAACNHTNLGGKVRREGELTFGALDTDIIADFDQGQVLRNVALLISLQSVLEYTDKKRVDGTCLYDKVKVTEVIIASRRGIAASNGLAINFGRNRDMLSRGEAKIVLGIGKTEAIKISVV